MPKKISFSRHLSIFSKNFWVSLSEWATLILLWIAWLEWDAAIVIGSTQGNPCHHSCIELEVGNRETLVGIHYSVVGAVILELILDELERRKTHTVEGDMVGAACLTRREGLESKSLDSLHPFLEIWESHVILLKIDATETT